MSTTFALLALFMLGTSSCNKYKQQPADLVVGDYTGVGATVNQVPFINESIRVTKVSRKKVKVEPIGHSHFNAFEVDLLGVESENAVASVSNAYNFAVDLDEEPAEIGFTSPEGTSFVGERQ